MSAGAAPPELHLPDLPEIHVGLGVPPRPGLRRRVRVRLREMVGTYLPLLLMMLLALGTWWLVKHTPRAAAGGDNTAVRSDPDYEMRDFTITRFAPDGRATVRLQGARLRHFPDTDRIEIEAARLHARAPDGRVTEARADKALANGDASEWQLTGGAQVVAQMSAGPPLQIEGEFLQVSVPTERVQSHLPVRLRQGSDEIRAGGIDADNLAQQLRLRPPVRASFAPRTVAPRPAP